MSGDVASSNESRGYGGVATGISGFVGLIVLHVVQHDRRQRLLAADDRLQLPVGPLTELVGSSYCRDLLCKRDQLGDL
ncbi:hypothetical protein [Natronorubrum sp. DTA28]|uniref:hypothetical protein n=1 Tax=Natronorubrum sp. DTA28 TaxID=3447019 RepID=UPI003F82D500